MPAPTVLRHPAEFTQRRTRLLHGLVRLAIRLGIFHDRPVDWVETTIAAGHARAVLVADRIVGFFAIRPAHDEAERAIVYASACLWRANVPGADAMTNAALVEEAAGLGTEIFGAFYKANAAARRFYTPARGWRVIQQADFPGPLRHEIEAYGDQIALVSRPLVGAVI